VGGATEQCRDLAAALYARIVREVVPVSRPEAAEMVKLFENTFRSVNVALVNEFAIMCRRLGLSVWEVIAAASTKPFGFMAFYPGPGLGGHCLPSDPHYLSWKVRLEGYEPRFITFADEINRRMPTYVVEMVVDALNDRGRALRGARVLVMGVAYKPGVADTRDSPALEIIDLLRAKGATVAYHDPYVPSIAVGTATLESCAWPEGLAARDVVLILTAHAGYDWAAIVREAPLVIDTRIAAGRLSVGTAITTAVVLIGAGLGVGTLLSRRFLIAALLYVVLLVAYSAWLKHVVIVDVIVVAGGFVLRAIAGAVVIDVEMSGWLLICTILLALFLALGKRRYEYLALDRDAALHRPILAEYSPALLDQMIAVVTASTVTAYALYTMSPETVAKFRTHL